MCVTERGRATSTSLFQDKERVKNIISLKLQDTHPCTHRYTVFQDAHSIASRGSGPQWDSEAITEHTVGRASLLSYTQKQKDIEFL